jgi:galactosylceramidase
MNQKVSQVLVSVAMAGAVVAASSSVVQGGTIPLKDITMAPLRFMAVPAGQVHDLGGFLGERYRLNTEDRLLGNLGFEQEKLLRMVEEKKTAEWNFVGEHSGKWLEAAIWSSQTTGNAALRTKAEETLRRMIAAQEPDGYLGIMATSLRTPAQPLRGMDPYEQYFTLHALITAYEAWGSKPALESAKKLADYYVKTVGPGKAEFWPKPEDRSNGCGTIAGHAAHQSLEGTLFIDPMMRLYQTTGEKRYLDWTQWVVNNINRWGKMNDPKLNVMDDLDLVADGKKPIGAVKRWSHSHTWHMNFLGMLRLYQATGDPTLLSKVEGAMRDIMSRQVFATGAVSVQECYQADQSLPNGESVAETCASMSWLELNQYLLEMTANPAYADTIEKVMVNHLPAAQASDGGGFRYHTALVGVKGRAMGGSTCCQGSGHRATAEQPRFFYATDKDGLFVNQFVASLVNVKLVSGTGVTLKQKTDYPSDGNIRIEVAPEKAELFSLRIRLPGWCDKPVLRVNGTPVADLKPGTYATVKREWKAGDVVELQLPMTPQWVKGEYNNSGLVCLKRGPVVYMIDGIWVEGGLGDLLSMEAVAVDTRATPVAEPLPAGFLGPALAVPVRVVDQPVKIVKMVPFANAGRWYVDEANKEKRPGRNLYGAWLAPVGRERNAAAVSIEVARREELPRVIDRTGPSFKDVEHNPKNGSQKPQGWSHLGYRTRHSGDWFSWDLKVLPDVPISLRVGCSGGEFGIVKFAFDVLVDGQKVGKMAVPSPEGRVDGVFELPKELTQGKEKITVRFQAQQGKQAGRVFDVLTVRGTTAAAAAGDATDAIVLDSSSPGRAFEGIGAVSAGASSRLLVDYPEPQRGQILDYLFKPNYGAGFQHLKVEVGSDMNSTDGTEPSHMRTRQDENYTRGYEWWLMKEAQSRNPDIILDCLAWAAPGWIGDGKFFSQDMADYYVKFIRGAKVVHGLDIRYVGLWNEKPYDAEWIKLLRQVLDKAGLPRVGIVASDLYQTNKWDLAEKVAKDPVLKAAIHAIGAHYPKFESPPAARSCGLPLWSSEDGPWSGDWKAAQNLARTYNRNYVLGKITKTEIWSPISSYYDNLPLPGSGVMRANTPWSGNYEVQPALWATAHSTQFARPGWVYIDSACRMIEGGSVVVLRSPDKKEWSLIIETTEAKNPQTLRFELKGEWPGAKLLAWKSTGTRQFQKIEPIPITGNRFEITLEPGAIASLTTLTSPRKGDAVPPPAAPFPLSYTDDFESYQPGATPRYCSDYAGAFEAVKRADDKGIALRQVIAAPGIEWQASAFPETFLGDQSWRDGEVSIDAMVEKAGFVSLFGHVERIEQNGNPPWGIWLKVETTGIWQLAAIREKTITKNGKEKKTGEPVLLASGTTPFAPDVWHSLKLAFRDDSIRAMIDGAEVAGVRSDLTPAGMVGFGSGWHGAQFDNLKMIARINVTATNSEASVCKESVP